MKKGERQDPVIASRPLASRHSPARSGTEGIGAASDVAMGGDVRTVFHYHAG